MQPYLRRVGVEISLVVLALSGSSAFAKGVEPRVETLDNGLKVLMVERHEQPMVAAGVFYDVGGVNDPHGKSGIAHLFEHMLFKGSKIIGTTDYEAEKTYIEQIEKLRIKMNEEMNRMRVMKRRGEISDVLDPKQWTPEYTAMKKQEDELVTAQRQYIKNNEFFNLYTTNGGAGLNAGTAEDITFYFVQLPTNKLELFFWLESDRMTGGIMREFYVERDNVREERRLRTDSTPTGKLDESFEALFWQAHPYGVPVLGWASEVESISAQDVRDFYKVHYAPNNAVLVLVGDFQSDKALALAKKYFGRLSRAPSEPDPLITEEPRPLGVRRLDAEAETNPRVMVRFHSVAMAHKDEPALDVLAGLLNGKAGRLYKRLVTKDDMVIGVPRGENSAQQYAGYFEIGATVKEGRDPQEVERIVVEELTKLHDGEITDRELQKVKNQVLAGSVRRLQSNFGLMLQLGMFETFVNWQYLNESPERIQKVTTDEVRAVARKYIDPKTRTVAIYRTKQAASGGSEDAELLALIGALPPERQSQAKKAMAEIEQATDPAPLKMMKQQIEQALGGGQVPQERRAVWELVVKRAEEKISQLEAGNKEKK
ncbi:MAG: insulinase family protein [Planctomycetota bacterium]